MASGKAMANPARGRRDARTDAEMEARILEMSAILAKLEKRTEDALASHRWHPYFVGAGFALALIAALSAILT